jgi:hypothetical protein
LFSQFVGGECKSNGTGFRSGYDPAKTLQTDEAKAATQEVYKISYGHHSHNRPRGVGDDWHVRGGDGSICAPLILDANRILLWVMLGIASAAVVLAAACRFYYRADKERDWSLKVRGVHSAWCA